jgi:hypothetical protein
MNCDVVKVESKHWLNLHRLIMVSDGDATGKIVTVVD